jgi:hypothetical protein
VTSSSWLGKRFGQQLRPYFSVEGIGTDPGTVEVIDLQSLTTVAMIDVPEQAAGIDFWKTEQAPHPLP